MTEQELWVNRTTSYLGMCFGGVVSMGVLVTSAMVLAPKRIVPDSYEQAALMFVPALAVDGSAPDGRDAPSRHSSGLDEAD